MTSVTDTMGSAALFTSLLHEVYDDDAWTVGGTSSSDPEKERAQTTVEPPEAATPVSPVKGVEDAIAPPAPNSPPPLNLDRLDEEELRRLSYAIVPHAHSA